MFRSLESKHPKFYQFFRIFIVIFASILYAWNLRCFTKNAGLFPSGFSGASLLLQDIGTEFLHVSIPFAVFNIGLNLQIHRQAFHHLFHNSHIAVKYIC